MMPDLNFNHLFKIEIDSYRYYSVPCWGSAILKSKWGLGGWVKEI